MGADMNSETKECCERIWGDYHSHKCSRPAKFEVDGKLYCGIHNPSRGPTKAQIQAEIDREARMKVYRLNAAAPDLLEALKNLLAVITGEGGTKPNAHGLARAAIAKATGAAA
jgi:hypothetical protein